MSRFSRRWITPVVLASYLLAATVSGMFHNHGGSCCSDGTCATAGTSAQASHAGCGRHHHRHHGHSHSAAGRHACKSSSSKDAPERRPGGHGPLHDPGCAACQFLAQQSVTAPRCELQSTGTLVRPVSEAVHVCVPSVVADAHPARGPPDRA